jgi:DNA-binding CsgD family transcriptional regulator
MSLIDKALAGARSSGRGDLEARALSLRGLVLGLTGRRQEGTEAARAGLSLAVAADDVEAAVGAHWVLGTIANHWADYDGAESAFDAAVELCGADDGRPGEQLCLSCIAIVAYNRGQWARAEELARKVLDKAGRPDVEAHALLVLGLISGARGATKRARPLLDRAFALGGGRGFESTVAQANAGLALVDELEGMPSARWQALVEAPPASLRQNYGWWLCRAATLAARRGDAALLRQCADVLAAWTSQFGGVEALAALAHILGEVMLLEGDAQRAAERFGRALELMSDVGAPFEVAHTQMRTGVALAGAGELEAGVGLLVDAYRTFRQLGARPFWLQASAELEALGEAVERRLGRRAARDLAHGGLTRRELEILRSVAVGRTNREIALELFVSPRTVDMHVRSLLRKLGCRTRTEATSQAHQLGLLEPTE